MTTPQPGKPSPSTKPRSWHLTATEWLVVLTFLLSVLGVLVTSVIGTVWLFMTFVF